MEWMRANRRQSLAELCNPKLVRLAQVPHRTADREDPKLARRKWQPPHNMGEPQTENTLDNTFKHRNCTNGQILRSGSKLIEAEDYTSIEPGYACFAARRNPGTVEPRVSGQ